MPDQPTTPDTAIDTATTHDATKIRERLGQVQFLALAAPAPGSNGRLSDVTLNDTDLKALSALVAHDIPGLLELVDERGAAIRLVASHRAADARALSSIVRRAEDLRNERDAAQRCLRRLLDALQLLAARWQGPDFQSSYGNALLTVMRNPARYLEVMASAIEPPTRAAGGRAITRLLAERLAAHAHCDLHPVTSPEPGCGYCQDRAAYLAYLAGGGHDFRLPGGEEIHLSDIPAAAAAGSDAASHEQKHREDQQQ